MTALVVRGDALRLPIRDESVDLICTSPPYFALRSYQTGHAMEVGSEATPQAYLEALWTATREMIRVLKPIGSIWVNLGDKYSNYQGPHYGQGRSLNGSRGTPKIPAGGPTNAPTLYGIPNKSLIGLPWRYAIGCIDQLGLILRAELIWSKPNGLPESVTDRVRRSHETWFHFVRQPRYYAALDELREPHQPQSLARSGRNRFAIDHSQDGVGSPNTINPKQACNPLGALPGSVWQIPSEPLRLPPWLGVQHYAAFPTEWPRRLILAFSPPGICTVCGQGRFPVVERTPMIWRQSSTIEGRTQPGSSLRPASGTMLEPASASILGYACGCCPHTDHPGTDGRERNGQGYAVETGRDAHPHGGVGMLPRTGPWREWHLDRWSPPPTRPAIICDPFGGTGTTALVARALGRVGVSVDLSMDYSRVARWRVFSPEQAAKTLGRTNLERQGNLL